MAMALHLAVTAGLLLVASGSNHNPLVIGQTFMAGSEDPTQGSTAWALASHGIAEKLFTVDKDGNIVGQIAESTREISRTEWEVTLKANYKFSDGTAVTAENVATALTRLNTDNDNAKASVGTMTVTAPDSMTVKIVTERATPVMDSVLAEWVFAIFLVKDGKFIFTGPFMVQTFTEGVSIDLVPNPEYPNADQRPHLQIKKYVSGEAVATALESGEVDMAFHLPIDTLSGLRQLDDVTIQTFEVGYHYMMWHNMERAPLSDVRVRKAIDMALDRQELSQELRGGAPTRSLFPEDTPYFQADTDPLNHDRTGAIAMLEEAGWVLNNGRRFKNGVQLTLHLVAYPQRPGLVIMAPVIQTTLDALGISCNVTITDGSSWDELDTIMASRDWDLLMWAQHTLPAGDPQWFLNAFFRSDGGNNHAGLNSAAIDQLLDDLATTENHAARVTATKAVHDAIMAERPVSNLMTPAWHVGFSERLSDYEPWGSDYYVIRANLGVKDTAVTTTEQAEADGASLAMCGFWIQSLLLLAFCAAVGRCTSV